LECASISSTTPRVFGFFQARPSSSRRDGAVVALISWLQLRWGGGLADHRWPWPLSRGDRQLIDESGWYVVDFADIGIGRGAGTSSTSPTWR